METITLTKNDFAKRIITWERLYLISLPSMEAKKVRLAQLETWDKAAIINGHESEHYAKIQALKNLTGLS